MAYNDDLGFRRICLVRKAFSKLLKSLLCLMFVIVVCDLLSPEQAGSTNSLQKATGVGTMLVERVIKMQTPPTLDELQRSLRKKASQIHWRGRLSTSVKRIVYQNWRVAGSDNDQMQNMRLTTLFTMNSYGCFTSCNAFVSKKIMEGCQHWS